MSDVNFVVAPAKGERFSFVKLFTKKRLVLPMVASMVVMLNVTNPTFDNSVAVAAQVSEGDAVTEDTVQALDVTVSEETLEELVTVTASVREPMTATTPEQLAERRAEQNRSIVNLAQVAPGQTIPASSIIAAARQWVGVVPYGPGNHPSTSFNCDGYVQYVFSQVGISLPRGLHAQAALGTPISRSDAKAGDLLYWPEGHIAIYDGNGGMYDTPGPGRYVQHRTSLWGNPIFIRL